MKTISIEISDYDCLIEPEFKGQTALNKYGVYYTLWQSQGMTFKVRSYLESKQKSAQKAAQISAGENGLMPDMKTKNQALRFRNSFLANVQYNGLDSVEAVQLVIEYLSEMIKILPDE